jgi:hypothetical protein
MFPRFVGKVLGNQIKSKSEDEIEELIVKSYLARSALFVGVTVSDPVSDCSTLLEDMKIPDVPSFAVSDNVKPAYEETISRGDVVFTGTEIPEIISSIEMPAGKVLTGSIVMTFPLLLQELNFKLNKQLLSEILGKVTSLGNVRVNCPECGTEESM